jgi:hypothetical protein
MSYTNPMSELNINQMIEHLEKIKQTFKSIKKQIQDEKELTLNAIDEQCRKNSEDIRELKRDMKAAQDVVEQLIAGLYNQNTQEKMHDLHMDVLFSKKVNDEKINESIWPTTRQGDENQSRIEELEKKVESAQEVIYQLIGGLFNHSTQSSHIRLQEAILFSEDIPKELYKECKLEDKDYTTRQGDENFERINQLEENMDKMVRRINKGKKQKKFYKKEKW